MSLSAVIYLMAAWVLFSLPMIYLVARRKLSDPLFAIIAGWFTAIVFPPLALLYLLTMTLIPNQNTE